VDEFTPEELAENERLRIEALQEEDETELEKFARLQDEELASEMPREKSGALDDRPILDFGTARRFVSDHLGTEDAALAHLHVCFSNYLAVLDPDAIAVVLATAVAQAETSADPLWLMLVGSSSGSKSETIRTVSALGDKNLSDLTRAGLLGGHAAKEGGIVRTGLLAKLGDGCNALVTISDLSSLLSRGGGRMSGQEQAGVYEALRDVYDGEYTRTMDRLEVTWRGRLTILAGVTPAIDAMRTYTTALGTRFCYFRLDQMTDAHRDMIARVVFDRSELKAHREAAQAQAQVIVEAAREKVTSVELPASMRDAVVGCANYASYGRVNLPRDYRGTVDGVADWEEPGRLTGQLVVLARSLCALGLGEVAMQRIVRRTAQSCMPADMLAVLRQCDSRRSTSSIAARSGLHRAVATRALEGWAATGVVHEQRVSDGTTPPPDEDGTDRRAREWVWSDYHREAIESTILRP
jgi:hypothetical protein